MSVAVLVPRGGTCPYREAAWSWVRERYATHHPHWEVVEGFSDPAAYSRTQAILDAASRTDADILVIADGDIWCDGMAQAVAHVTESGWAIPHWYVHRLSKESSARVLAGEPWEGLPLSHDNRQDLHPYKGHETGTLVVMTRHVFEDVPPDPRFVQWGQEDAAWSLCLRRLVGTAWRARFDLIHLWHPPQPRKSRSIGTDANLALYRRYRKAMKDPDALRALIAEGAADVSRLRAPLLPRPSSNPVHGNR